MATDRGLLIVLSGPSGCGKGTLVSRILERHPDTVLSVSVTTRAPRPGEVDGVHYYFKTVEQVEQMIRDDALLEYAQYSGNYYGTPREAVEQHLQAGRNVILEIEVQGAMQVMSHAEDYVSIFLTVPSMEELERRLRGRGTEEESFVQKRLKAAEYEMQYIDRYQHVVLNDVIEDAMCRLEQIISEEKARRTPQ